jgi:hypothetical protein
MSSPSKKEMNEMYKAIVTEDFDAKAKEAKSKAGTEEGSDLLSFDQALLFDEGMLNSWFQEDALPIRDRAILLQRMRQYKESFAHQSTEAIESELTTKMLFDALLFAVAFTVPTGVDRAEMQEAWMADDALYNVSKSHLLGTYEVLLLVMTYLVTTSTGMALIIGFTIYGCLHSARPSSIEEADAFYARFKVAFRLSYGFTYAAVLLTPFSCLELHFIKSSSEPTRVFFAMYGYILYGTLVVFLTWSLREARRWKVVLNSTRKKLRDELLKEAALSKTRSPLMRWGSSLSTPRSLKRLGSSLSTPRGLRPWGFSFRTRRGPETATPASGPIESIA